MVANIGPIQEYTPKILVMKAEPQLMQIREGEEMVMQNEKEQVKKMTKNKKHTDMKG